MARYPVHLQLDVTAFDSGDGGLRFSGLHPVDIPGGDEGGAGVHGVLAVRKDGEAF